MKDLNSVQPTTKLSDEDDTINKEFASVNPILFQSVIHPEHGDFGRAFLAPRVVKKSSPSDEDLYINDAALPPTKLTIQERSTKPYDDKISVHKFIPSPEFFEYDPFLDLKSASPAEDSTERNDNMREPKYSNKQHRTNHSNDLAGLSNFFKNFGFMVVIIISIIIK